jgi:hypothetical protein
MQVGMSEKSLAPSVENCHKTDVGAQVFGISRDLEEGLGGSAKQQAVNQSLILQGQRSEKVGQSEDDMKVGDGQQFGGTVFQPALTSCCLAFWAMPIQARVIGDGSLSATVTLFDVPTECRGTTSGNGTQDFEVETGYPAAMPFYEGCAIGPNNVGHL